MSLRISRAFLLLILGMLVVSIPSAFAQSSLNGTSNITFSMNAITINVKNIAPVYYRVALSSGKGGTTNISIFNYNALLQEGIIAHTSKSSGIPPFDGTLTIQTTAAAKTGSYPLVLIATGIDPSNTPAVLYLNVTAVGNTPLPPGAAGLSSNVVANSNSINSSSTVVQNVIPTQTKLYILAAAIAIILILAIISVILWRTALTRIAIIGIALLAEGVTVWLYDGFKAVPPLYIWIGIPVTILGVIVWACADFRADTLKSISKSAILAILGIILIIIGTVAWFHATYSVTPGITGWLGLIAIILGAIIWIIGDYRAGIFIR